MLSYDLQWAKSQRQRDKCRPWRRACMVMPMRTKIHKKRNGGQMGLDHENLSIRPSHIPN
ncbi:MAG: hypothetical protein BYD32DRAFT_427430 [Podila humilis]|nr:MAG: hypothetical protein BYD32DRAFT_427430 [Podila humilis]